MFNIFNILKGDNDMGRRYTKTEKVKKLFNTGVSVTWKQLRNKFGFNFTQMVGKLRNEGMMIYENRTSVVFLIELIYHIKSDYRLWYQQSIWEANCLLKLLKLIRLEAVSNALFSI